MPLPKPVFPHVSSEGGPILIGDFKALLSWRGVANEHDYLSLDPILAVADPNQIVLNGNRSIVWSFGGSGTADLVKLAHNRLSIVRIWPDSRLTRAQVDEAIAIAAGTEHNPKAVGRIDISCGYLLAIWAPEDAASIRFPPDPSKGNGIPGLSMGGAGAYVEFPSGQYEVEASDWKGRDHNITKLDLKLSQ